MGKRYGITTILALLAVFKLTTAYAAYYSVGIGNGGSAKKKSLTVAVGQHEVKFGSKPFLLGLGLPFIDHGDSSVPQETNDSPCPHSGYKSLGKKSEGIEAGFLGKIGVDWFHLGVYTSLLAGMTRVHEVHLTQSIYTDQYYEQSAKNRWMGVYGISLAFFPEVLTGKTKLNVHLDLDNRRGITGAIGWGW